MKKIVALKELKSITSIISRKKRVLVGGCFDVFHYGHLAFLKKAKAQGDFLIVALEGDRFIKKHKRKNPVHTQSKRAEILASLTLVDLVVTLPYLQSDKDYFELVRLINPSIIAVTQGDFQLVNKKKQATALNARLKIVTDYIEGFSSKKIIKAFN